jgi:hypothetical protein
MNTVSSEPFVCFKCGTPYQVKERVGRRDTCSGCDADLHCCYNCRHYKKTAHNECNEVKAEWVRDKDRANFCDYFEPRRGGVPEKNNAASDDARSRFEDLFR